MTEPPINCREREFYRYSDVVANARRSRARASAEAVYRDYVRARTRNAGRDSRDIVNCRYLDDDRLFVFGRFLDREN